MNRPTLGDLGPIPGELVRLLVWSLAAAVCTVCLEISRTLAEHGRGRWWAGNGRDVFHLASGATLAIALGLTGFPPALALVLSATVHIPPLLFIDWLPPVRTRRLAALFAAFALGAAPAFLAPAALAAASDACARALFGA